jgi:transcriptional regulator with XRE-family HTH domain
MEQRQKYKVSKAVQQAKMDLAAAHAVGESALLREVAVRYPAQLEELADFVAGLYATDVDEQEAALLITADIEAITLRARQRALDAVFVTASATQTVETPVRILAQERKARGLSLMQLGQRLDLGVDVVQKLEQGRITVASLPQRLTDRLADVLALSRERIGEILQKTPGQSLQPALLRRRTVGRTAPSENQPAQPQTFAEAVQRSPSMTDEQRAFWLEEEREG